MVEYSRIVGKLWRTIGRHKIPSSHRLLQVYHLGPRPEIASAGFKLSYQGFEVFWYKRSMHLNARRQILKVILSWIGNQWSFLNMQDEEERAG